MNTQELIYKSSQFCEFTMIAIFDEWEAVGNVSAFQVASQNNIPMNVWWDFYRDYKAMKRA